MISLGCVLNENQLHTEKQYLGYMEFPSTGFHMWEHKWGFHVFENVRNMHVKVSYASILRLKNIVGKNNCNVNLKSHSTYSNRLFKCLHNGSIDKWYNASSYL
jgi:hypothetical protein